MATALRPGLTTRRGAHQDRDKRRGRRGRRGRVLGPRACQPTGIDAARLGACAGPVGSMTVQAELRCAVARAALHV